MFDPYIIIYILFACRQAERRTCSDAAMCSVWYGSALLAYVLKTVFQSKIGQFIYLFYYILFYFLFIITFTHLWHVDFTFCSVENVSSHQTNDVGSHSSIARNVYIIIIFTIISWNQNNTTGIYHCINIGVTR